MTFAPQFSNWSLDDFVSDEGAVYLNPGEFEINNGVVGLVPILFSGQNYAFNAPWDPISSWNIESTMDSIPIVTGIFSIISTTGFVSTESGSYGNSGVVAQTAFFTKTNTPVTGANGQYISGQHSAFVYNANAISTAAFNTCTVELSVRSIASSVTHDLYSAPSSGVSCHGVYFGGTTTNAFVEIHPNGLKVHGVTGGILPGDYSSTMRRIRLVRSARAITLMSDDGSSIFIDNAAALGSNPSKYLAFGAPPFITGNGSFTGVNGTFHNFSKYDSYGLTGIGGYEGTVLWDDIKVKFGQAVTTYTDGYLVTWPSGTKTLYTSPWYPAKNISNYAAVTLDVIPYSGGSITVSPQYLAPSGLSGQSVWTDASTVTPLTVTNLNQLQYYMDISSVPVYNGIENALRFKMVAVNSGRGPGPQIDSLSVIGKAPYNLVDVVPNWKLSALPKDIYFLVNKDQYNSIVPPSHYQDEIYILGSNNTGIVPVDQFLPAPEQNHFNGLVASTSTGLGIQIINDGLFGKAVRNFVKTDSYSGTLTTNSFSQINTGIFIGNLLDSYAVYPDVANVPTGSTGNTTVLFTVDQYTNLQGQLVNAQRVDVQGYFDSTGQTPIGFKIASISGNTTVGQVGIIEGVIQIEKGPGAMVTIYDNGNPRSYLLDGLNYREPKSFSCAAYYTGNSINTSVSIGALPRSVQPSGLDPLVWGDWKSKIEAHDTTSFTVFGLTGYLAKHSYLVYGCTGNPARTSPLDSNSIYSTVPYYPVRRDSAIFEGMIRPFGLIGSSHEASLFETVSADGRGLRLFINRSGELRATVELNMHVSSLGLTGDGIQMVGPRSNGLVATGQTGTISVTSNSETISWGDWNHIGIYQDVRTIGDTYTAKDQPGIADTGIYHAARTARLYLEIDSRIVGSADIAIDGYYNNIVSSGAVGNSYPSSEVRMASWPRIPIYATTGIVRTGTIGQNVICDFDHVRFGIRNHVDAKTWATTYGAKDSPPTFIPWNGIKIMDVRSGTKDHYQYAHIYRFDHPNKYQLWDDGFAIDHAIALNYSNFNLLKARGIKPAKFLINRDDGPKGRSAVRIGPGANILIPFNSYDERVYNGTGSCSMVQGTITANNASGLYYIDNTFALHPNMETWVTGYRDFLLTNANSRFVAGGFFKLHSYPTGLIGDLFSFEESLSSATSSNYGLGDFYVGVDNSGRLTCGQRRNFAISGTFIAGPLTGDIIPLNEYTFIGVDANLQSGNGFINLYRNSGEYLTGYNLIQSQNGGPGIFEGRPMGYQGILGGSTSNSIHKANFVIGGEQPKNTVTVSYPYMDISVSEFFIGFPFTGYSWPWNKFGTINNSLISGHADISIKDSNTIIAPVYGTGSGDGSFYNAVTRYPATDYTGSSEHLFWTTSNGGHDFEPSKDFGVQLYDPTNFVNAESYYVIYENDSATENLGSTDSPIQLGIKVPGEGVNLALIGNKEWTTDLSLTTFDLSDRNYNNISNKIGSNFTLKGFVDQTGSIYSTGRITSDDIRVSSFSLWDNNSSNTFIGYFTHLIGGDQKAVYIPNAFKHTETTGSYNLYHLNLDKIEKNITVKDIDGNVLSFDEFPYRIIASPYGPNADLPSISGSLLGYGPNANTGQFNTNQLFTCQLIAEKQTIGKTVFIHYPSRNYLNNTVNLQDSEVYNPIPLMKQLARDQILDIHGNTIAPTGSFSLELDSELKKYNIRIWGANLTGWAN